MGERLCQEMEHKRGRAQVRLELVDLLFYRIFDFYSAYLVTYKISVILSLKSKYLSTFVRAIMATTGTRRG
jgi:hypothetical protein